MVGFVDAGHAVGLELVDLLHVRVWFHKLELGLLEVEPSVDSALFEMPPTTKNKRTRVGHAPANQT
jgi:hypothetical protein